MSKVTFESDKIINLIITLYYQYIAVHLQLVSGILILKNL